MKVAVYKWILLILWIIALSRRTRAMSVNSLGNRVKRLSEAEPMTSYSLKNVEGPGTLSYGFNVFDDGTGRSFYRDEVYYPNGTVAGSYGYEDDNGQPVHVNFVADSRGYRILSYENRFTRGFT